MTSPPSEKRDASSVSEHAEKPDSVKIDIKGAPPAPKPVSFFTLFRFATRTENFLNVIGLFAAAAVGSAQPLLSLLFGRFANSFVNFGLVAAAVKAGDASPEQIQLFREAQARFRHQSEQNALYLAIMGIGAFFLSYLFMWIWTWTGEMNSRRIRERYLKGVLRQDIAYFDTLGAGEVATRIQSDTDLIQTGISEKVALVAQYSSSFFAGFIIAYVRSWRLALALTSIVPCIVLSGSVMGRIAAKLRNQSQTHIANGGSFAEEVISTIRTAHAFGIRGKLEEVFNSHMMKSYKLDLKAAAYQAVGISVFLFVVYCAYALAFNFGTTLILQGHGNVGVVVNVFMAVIYGSLSFVFLVPELQAIAVARGAAAKIFETIERVPTIDSESTEGRKLDTVTGTVSLEDVHFTYASRPDVQVLKGLSLSFTAGKTSALVGASGSGKSTIVALAERFYDPIGGAVKLDGVDLRNLNVRWLRSQIGLVSQEPILFSTSIRNNVAYGLVGTPWESADDNEKFELIKAACVKANADSFVAKLPDGYDTQVGERGILLSGGQKQRIAIARAIVGDPAILILDEATSALDTQSEGIVQDALNKASQGRTTITVAHRLSTIKDAGCIYVMGEGELIESGTHEHLLRNPDGAYAQLVNAQKLRDEEIKAKMGNSSIAKEGGIMDDSAASGTFSAADSDFQSPQTNGKGVIEEPLSRVTTGEEGRSVASEVLSRRARLRGATEPEYGGVYLFKRMAMINKDITTTYVIGAMAAMLCGMSFPVIGIVYGLTIQGFQTTNRHQLRHNGDRNALWFFIIAIIHSMSTWVQNSRFQKGASALTWKLRVMCLESILQQDIAWFDGDTHSTGALVSNLATWPQRVLGLAGVTLGSIFSSSITLVGGWIIGLIYCWKLALVGMCSSPFLFSMGYTRLRVVGLKHLRNKKEHAASAQIACEVAGAIKTVASLTREQAFYKEYSDSLELPLQRSNRLSLWTSALFGLVQSFLYLTAALTFWYGSRLVSNLEFSTRDFFTCLMCVTFGSMQAGNAFNFVPDVSSAKGAADDMVRLLDSKPEIDADARDGVSLDQDQISGHLELRDVHFRYPSRPGVAVLRGLNIMAEPGSYVAIVGPSGSGKSTVIQLLERFYDPQSGKVLIDGKDITELSVQDYRAQLALVSQEPTLYAGSIKFNILLGATKPADEVTQAELDKACKDANIYDFITSLPQGLDTEVGGKGSQLSGGQKQRIAIARALIRNPKVLLLDEATSALDSTSEKVVQQALDTASKGRTTISIAHRLATIQNADQIYYIKDGRIAEAGTHDELLRLRGGYYELVQLQALNSGKEIS